MSLRIFIDEAWGSVRYSRAIRLGGAVVICFALVGALAPVLLTVDPNAINPIQRLRPPSSAAWLGTDAFGRDLYSRVIYGCRTSLIIGLGVVLISTVVGLFLGLMAGYFRPVDAIVMRVMDGLMAIPGILLAIALVAVTGASLATVIVAISIPEIPRVVRLIRGTVLSVRERPYVEAAIAAGTRTPKILLKHILPFTIAPLMIMASYIACHAILVEAALSFLGAGLPSEIASLGNIIADGRRFFSSHPQYVFIPGAVLSIIVLAINALGDGLRDQLDPRARRRR